MDTIIHHGINSPVHGSITELACPSMNLAVLSNLLKIQESLLMDQYSLAIEEICIKDLWVHEQVLHNQRAGWKE